MSENLPSNCWVSPAGEAHPVPRSQHGVVAQRIAEEQGIEDEELFRPLYSLGYVRIQWENTRRINVAFHVLTCKTRERLQDFIDIMLHSDVSIYVVSPEGSEFLQPGDRRWKQKLEGLNAAGRGTRDRFMGSGPNKSQVIRA